jgi:ribosomal protein S18 acetylase RimI-like enzyme
VFSRTKPIQVVQAVNPDRQSIANLIHFGAYVHRHLDWRPPLDWIGHPPFLVARREDEMIGVLVCPPDPPNVAWIRLFAVAHGAQPEKVWQELWSVALPQLRELPGSLRIAVIPLHNWFETILMTSEFRCDHKVIVLSWESCERPIARRDASLKIRPMVREDLPEVEKIDEAAFGGVWRNSQSCLEIAYRQSALASVAESNGHLLGYQISTATQMGGHLARLAVFPDHQGSGVGYALLDDLLSQFEKRGTSNVTVNTQHDNRVSLSLYQKAGFRLTGEEYPVYEYDSPLKNS